MAKSVNNVASRLKESAILKAKTQVLSGTSADIITRLSVSERISAITNCANNKHPVITYSNHCPRLEVGWNQKERSKKGRQELKLPEANRPIIQLVV